MRSIFSCLLFYLASASEFDFYGGSYLPTTKIRDYAALDLDQLEMSRQLSMRKIIQAHYVYQSGGFSGSYAVLTLLNLTAASYTEGSIVRGEDYLGFEVVGYLAKSYSWSADTDEVKVEIRYAVSNTQENDQACQVGGLWQFSMANRKGCECSSFHIQCSDMVWKASMMLA